MFLKFQGKLIYDIMLARLNINFDLAHNRNNQLFWTNVHNDSVFIWRSKLDGSGAIPLFDTGASRDQYGKLYKPPLPPISSSLPLQSMLSDITLYMVQLLLND